LSGRRPFLLSFFSLPSRFINRLPEKGATFPPGCYLYDQRSYKTLTTNAFQAMHYQLLKPAPALKPFVSCYWLLETTAPTETQRQLIIPDGYSELIFNLGAPYPWQMQGETRQIPAEGAVLVGERTQTVSVDLPPALRQIGVKLKPAALSLLTRSPSDQLRNRLFTAKDLNLPALSVLAERLSEITSFPEAGRLLDAYFGQVFGSAAPDRLVNGATTLLLAHRGNLRVDTLLRPLGVSYKVLEKRFRTRVGISPKEFGRIIRFKHTYRALRQHQAADPYFFLDYGYYDQSHFVREFKQFMGLPPRTFLAAGQATDQILRQGGSAWLTSSREG